MVSRHVFTIINNIVTRPNFHGPNGVTCIVPFCMFSNMLRKKLHLLYRPALVVSRDLKYGPEAIITRKYSEKHILIFRIPSAVSCFARRPSFIIFKVKKINPNTVFSYFACFRKQWSKTEQGT